MLIIDPRGIQAFDHTFDIAGRKLVIDSQDAGLKKMLPDVQGNPIYTWDANGNRVTVNYDALRRPTQTWNKPGTRAEFLADQIIYGEAKPSSETTNHRGQVWKVYDGAGLAINEHFDFKGNLEQGARRLLKDGTLKTIHWPHNNRTFDENNSQSLLETLTYTSKTEYDGLNRVTHSETPDGTVQKPHYNEANLLDGVTVKRSNGNLETFVKNIDYNARGQHTLIEYGNGVITNYTYESETFRLSTLNTTRKGTQLPKELQQLTYTYDPVGNITEISDDAHPKIFNSNRVVEPRSRYIYDAIYRLRQATGREHESMSACHYQNGNKKHTEFLPLPQSTNNAQALVMYTEVYNYDVAGNITRVQHAGAHTTTRTQRYADDSNRIVSSQAGCSGENMSMPNDANGNITNLHDGNGNITKLSHLPDMQWDFKNQLVNVQLNEGVTPNHAFYQYDASGQRVRKTVVKNNKSLIEERIYLGGYEIYQERDINGDASFRRDTVHVLDDTNRIALIEEVKDTRSSATVLNSRVRYQLSNHLGSAVLELDDTQDARIISYEEYYPYGGTAYMARRHKEETRLKCYRYSGKERDDETGLYYYGARYYAPWLGRWVSCDPLGLQSGINLYQFASSNPIVRVDQEGMSDTNTVSTPKVSHNTEGQTNAEKNSSTNEVVKSIKASKMSEIAGTLQFLAETSEANLISMLGGSNPLYGSWLYEGAKSFNDMLGIPNPIEFIKGGAERLQYEASSEDETAALVGSVVGYFGSQVVSTLLGRGSPKVSKTLTANITKWTFAPGTEIRQLPPAVVLPLLAKGESTKASQVVLRNAEALAKKRGAKMIEKFDEIPKGGIAYLVGHGDGNSVGGLTSKTLSYEMLVNTPRHTILIACKSGCGNLGKELSGTLQRPVTSFKNFVTVLDKNNIGVPRTVKTLFLRPIGKDTITNVP